MNIKSADAAAKKFATRGSAAGGDYSDGVKNPRTDWATATAAAAQTYAAGVQQAIGNGSFAKGVAAAGTGKWQMNSVNVGSQRFASGVQNAQGAYSKGVAPYLDTLRNLTLPPRAPKGDPSNIARVATIASALRSKKLAG